MSVTEQAVMPFCENWAKYLKRKSDAELLVFFKTYLAMCFDGYEAKIEDGEAYDYYWIMSPMITSRVKSVEAGRKGGRPKKGEKGEGFSEGLKGGLKGVSKSFRKEKNRNEENRNEVSDTAHAPADSASVAETVDGGAADDLLAGPAFDPDPDAEAAPATVGGYPVGPNGLPIVTPTLADVREAGRRLGCDPAFAEYFHAEMEKLGWQSRDRGGRMFAVDRWNLMSILRGWWQTEKKNAAARDSQEAARMAANVEGLGLHDTIMDPQNPFKVDE